MSQLVYVRTPEGILLSSDSLTSSDDELRDDVPAQFPKVFQIGRVLVGAVGVFQTSQMILNIAVEVGAGRMTDDEIEVRLLREYRDFCEKRRDDPDFKRVFQSGDWNASLVVVGPDRSLRVWEDGAPTFRGVLRGAGTSNPMVFGPNPQRENQTTFAVQSAMSGTHDLDALRLRVDELLMETATLFPLTVGPPNFHIVSANTGVRLEVEHAEIGQCIEYGNPEHRISRPLKDWMRPDLLAKSS